MRFLSQLALAAMFTAALSLMNPAMAGCRRMGFTVNDYGLEGPKRDAQNLLDKHISEWAAEQGIEKFNVGKKDVSCELYLNLIVFDEHTCTATATVCWGDSINRNQPQTASTKSKSTPAKKEATAKSKSSETKQPAEDKKAAEAAPSDDETAADSTTTAQSDADAKSETARESAAASQADENEEASGDATLETATAIEADADKPKVETGAIPVPNTAAGAAAAVSPLTADNAAGDKVTAGTASSNDTSGPDDASSTANSAAAAAAEAAAAAAERAASAAERAAKAAERAAAALADMPKSSSSEGPAKGNDAPSSSPSTGSPVAPVKPTP